MQTPNIVLLPDTHLIGMRTQTTLATHHPAELWRKFRTQTKHIPLLAETGFYSVQFYPPSFYTGHFTPDTPFEKWAALHPHTMPNPLPSDIEICTLSGGLYAVFVHTGGTATFFQTANYIYNEWIPNSPYQLDTRAHFEIMPANALPNQTDYSENVYIPIKNS